MSWLDCGLRGEMKTETSIVIGIEAANDTMTKKVGKSAEMFSPDIAIISEGEALGQSGIQPDIVIMAKN